MPVPTASANSAYNTPDSWPSANSDQPVLIRTPNDGSGCLMTDAAGENLIEGALGAPPQPCPTSGTGAVPLPITNTPQSFVVASRQMPPLPAGATIDAAADIEVSTPDFQTLLPDAFFGQLILASSPTATSGTLITDASGGYVDWPNLQHHLTLAARGGYTAPTSLPGPLYVNFVLTMLAARSCQPGSKANPCYDPCAEDGSTVSEPPYDRICVNAGYSLLSVQLFRPAARGNQLMAIDPMVATPVTPAVLSYGQQTPVWVSPPITGLAPGQVITASANLGFSWDQNTGGGPLPQCDPNIWMQITLVNQGATRALRMTPSSPQPLTAASPSTNLTVGEPRTTLTGYGSVQLPTSSSWSGTWYVVIAAGAAEDSTYGCLDDPVAVGASGGASDAAAWRFRAAAAGEAGWQERPVAIRAARVSTVPGPETTLYTTPSFPGGISPRQLIDVAGAAELISNNCASSIQTGLYLDGQRIDPAAAAVAPANAAGYPSKRTALTAGGAEQVPYDGGSTYNASVTLTVAAQPNSALCIPTAPLSVVNPGGGVYVESYWPTTVVGR